MARIRSIKPEFWTAEQVMECSLLARLLFIGMWNFCDDGGNHIASHKTLKAEVFPADDILSSDIEKLVGELIENGLVEPYAVDGRAYWHVTGWHHQKIDQPTYKHPSPDGVVPAGAPKRRSQTKPEAQEPIAREVFAERSPNSSEVFAERSPPERKGEEGIGVNPKTNPLPERVNNLTSGTPAGLVCARLKSECRIVTGLNPQNPKLIALLDAGLTADEIVAAGMDAKVKTFAYVLATAEGRRRDAAEVSTLPQARASPRMSHADASKLAAARAIFGTEIEGENHGQSERIINAAPVARLVGG